MSGSRRRTSRDARRRIFGQNFLVDRLEIARLIEAVRVKPGELIVEFGAGRGTLTVDIARRGGLIIAIEADDVWADQLRRRVAEAGLGGRVRVVHADFGPHHFLTDRIG